MDSLLDGKGDRNSTKNRHAHLIYTNGRVMHLNGDMWLSIHLFVSTIAVI